MLPWLDLLLLKSSHPPAPCMGCEQAGALGTACCRALVSAELPWSWHTLSSMAWGCSWPGRWVSWALILALFWGLGQLTSPLCVRVAPPERAPIIMGFAGASGKQDPAPANLQFEQWCQEGFDHQLLPSRVAAKGLAEQADCNVLLDLNRRCLE